MKKIILPGLLIGLLGLSACNNDSGYVQESNYYQDRNYQPQYQCNGCAQPFAMKTQTEVIDHYQVYQPVTAYQPAGTFSQRAVVQAQRPCNY